MNFIKIVLKYLYDVFTLKTLQETVHILKKLLNYLYSLQRKFVNKLLLSTIMNMT